MVDADTFLAMGQEKLCAIAQGTIAKLGGTTDDSGSANWTDAK